MKKEYEMTEADFEQIKEACKPVLMIALQCGTPSSPQENANRAWKVLGERMGFDDMTVEPSSKGARFFTADEMVRAADRRADQNETDLHNEKADDKKVSLLDYAKK